MQPGVKFNLKITVLKGKQQLVSGRGKWVCGGWGTDSSARAPGADSGWLDLLQLWAAYVEWPQCPQRAGLARSLLSALGSLLHSPREDKGQFCCLATNCPHWPLLIPFLHKEVNWLRNSSGKWNKASGLRALLPRTAKREVVWKPDKEQGYFLQVQNPNLSSQSIKVNWIIGSLKNNILWKPLPHL